MLKIVYAVLVVAIKDLKVCLSNLNQPTGKSAIHFEPLAHKREAEKQTAGALYFKY